MVLAQVMVVKELKQDLLRGFQIILLGRLHCVFLMIKTKLIIVPNFLQFS
jgi:hypothetical protein